MTKKYIPGKKAGLILFLIVAALSGVVAGAFMALTHDLPEIRSLETYRPSATTRIYSSDGVILSELFMEKRDPVLLKEIPDYLKLALITTEDRNFYKHSGLDFKGIARAVIKDIKAGGFVEGASTITQQLAKTLFLTSEKTLVRKLKEAVLAFQIERRYTKDEILELYLNEVYFGSSAYGVESAARTFFGKSVIRLDLSECALIAAMPKAPSRYSPLVNKDLAVKRRNIILKQMLKTGVITDFDYKKAVDQQLDLSSRDKSRIQAPYFVEYVKRVLEETLGDAVLYKGGLVIYTTLSWEMQKAAENAVGNGLGALDKRMKRNGVKDPKPQSALIALDVESGGILAMVGGRDFNKTPFNRAVSAKRQPGSAFKPILYAYAIENGFSQNDIILDSPVVFKGAVKGIDWEPENFSRSYLGEITLRKALTLSKNIPAVRLIEMLGPSSVADFAHSMGINSRLTRDFSLSLGTSEVTLMDLTSAYAVFPDKGLWTKPFCVTQVLDHRGSVIWLARPHRKFVMSRAGAAIVTDMLQGVIKEGTGRKARVLGRPVAGKTGTTNSCKDALFIGFSPSIAAGVWVGMDRHVTMGNSETGARAALPIWIEFMQKTRVSGDFQYFDIPDNVVKQFVNDTTGLKVPENAPGAVAVLLKKNSH